MKAKKKMKHAKSAASRHETRRSGSLPEIEPAPAPSIGTLEEGDFIEEPVEEQQDLHVPTKE